MVSLNPYIAGNPVGGTPGFIGRADVLREVLRVMRQRHQNIIVLYGQRRIGKTSVLQQLAAHLPQEGNFYPVYFDLQDKASWTLGRVLTDLARVMSYELVRQGPSSLKQTGPLLSDVDSAQAFQETWLPTTLNRLPEGHSIVLLFDEFDVLADPKGGQAGADLFPYLRGLLSTDPARLQFAFVIGRKVEDLESIALSLFKGAPSLRVSLLNKVDTFELVRLSERNETLRWSEESLEKVWDLTHGHPFLTQQLCSRIWENLYDTDPTGIPTVLPEDVEDAILETLEASRNTLEWLWDGLPPAERVVLSALAGAGNRAITQPQLEQLLRESGVRVVIRELQNAPQLLQDWDLIEPSNGGFRFRVELFRQWILEHKPLTRVQEELDRIEPLAENLYQAAYGFFRTNQLEDAIPLLRQAIGLNPNHARSRQLLAEILLLRGEVDQAVQILQLLYDTQPAVARPRLVQALLLKAEEDQEEEKRQAIFQQILLIDPGHPVASLRVAEFQRVVRQQELAQLLEDLQKTEKEKRYREAFEVARKLAEKYPDERDWQPDLDRLERKTKLADDYQRAIGAWNSGDKETALRGLADVIALEPDYEEATRYLHLAKTGQDPVHLLSQLTGEQKAHNRAKTRLEEETLAHAEAERQRDELHIRLESEKQHTESYRRMSRRMLYWSIGSTVLAIAFFIAWFVRGVVNDADLAATQMALAQEYTELAQMQTALADETPLPSEIPTDTPTESPTDPLTEEVPTAPAFTPTAPLTVTQTPEPTSPANPYAAPVPEAAFARLGKGRILSTALSSDGQWLAVGSTVGVFVYDANTFEQAWGAALPGGTVRVAFSPDSTTLATGVYGIDLWNVATGERGLTLERQDTLIKALAFSRDGTVLAAGMADGRVTTWNTESGSRVTTLEGDGSSITALAFSPAADALAGVTQSGSVFLWNSGTVNNSGVVLGTHTNGAYALAFSPDGSLLASGGEDNRINLWDLASQSQNSSVSSVTTDDAVFSLAFATMGNLLVSGQTNGELVVWNWANWEVQQTLAAHTDWVMSLAFYPDGTLFSASEDKAVRSDWEAAQTLRSLAGFTSAVLRTAYAKEGNTLATGDEKGNVLVWDTVANQPIQTLAGRWGRVYALAFSPVNSNLLAAGYFNRNVVLWNLETEEALELGSHAGWITDLDFSPDGNFLASTSEDATFIIWDLKTNSQAFVSEEFDTGRVESVAFSPDGLRLASGSSDGHIYLWNPANWELINTLTGHTDTDGSVESLAFSLDGRWLASGSSDNMIKVWDMTGQEAPRELKGHSSTVWSVAFSPADTNLLASGSLDADVMLWNVQTGDPLYTFVGHTEQIYSISFSPDGTTLASGSSDGTVILWDTNPEQMYTLSGGHGEVYSVAFSMQGGTLASAAADGTITLWDVATGKSLNTLTGPAEALTVAFSPVEETILAVGFGNGEILIWNLSNLTIPPRSLNRHTGAVNSIAFSPDGKTLASGSEDTNILIWDLNATAEPRLLNNHDSAVHSVAFSPTNAELLISGSDGGTVIIWDVPTGLPINSPENQQGHTAQVLSVAFPVGGNILASASEDRSIILWNAANGMRVGEIGDHNSGVLCVAFWPAGSVVASGTRNGQIYLWPLAGNSTPIILSGHTEEVTSLVFSRDGTILASASADGTIVLWTIPNILP